MPGAGGEANTGDAGKGHHADASDVDASVEGGATVDASTDAAEADAHDGNTTHKAPCDATHLDCDLDPKNGCETDTQSDVGHCGGCNVACSNAGTTAQLCSAGVCKATCDANHLDCNGDGKDGCETDAQNDAANCGACKYACSKANASAAACVKGACTAACATGFGDCGHPKPAADDGCETDLNAPANCGACGHDCAGATCTTRACDSLTFASAVDSPSSVTVDDVYVHWTQIDTQSHLGIVLRAPVRGGQATTVASKAGAGGVANDGSYVYWCGGSPAAIKRQLIGTIGEGTTVISDSSIMVSPCPMAVDATNVYWADYGIRQVFKMPKDGSGQPGALTATFNIGTSELVVDGPNLYYGAGSVTPISGDGLTMVTTFQGGGQLGYTAFDGTYVYYQAQIGQKVGVARTLKTMAGAPEQIYPGAGNGPLAVDATYLYVADDTGIYRFPKAGGAGVLVSSEVNRVVDMVLVKNVLYWVNQGTVSTSDGSVKKLAL